MLRDTEKHKKYFSDFITAFNKRSKEIDEERGTKQISDESHERWERHLASVNYTMSSDLEEYYNKILAEKKK